jgi:cell fate regulator YaaT (PSP1 superfamily)
MSYIEVQFKGNRRIAFTNPMEFPVNLGDTVIVQVEKGEDMGRVVQIADENRISDEDDRDNIRPVLRKADAIDFERRDSNLVYETKAEDVGKRLVSKHRLPMKIINVEYQLDGKKVTFFFTADGRVDFRNLVKDLAGELRTRIDLRQIGARDEAKKFGGFGPCGQRQCCSGWLSRFEPIATTMAKEQNLPLNPIKLSGNCGRLKCCLRYELEFYRSQKASFPSMDRAIETINGLAFIDKIDIFADEAIIRYKTGEAETVSKEQLKLLMDFDSNENHCESSCGDCGQVATDPKKALAAPDASAMETRSADESEQTNESPPRRNNQPRDYRQAENRGPGAENRDNKLDKQDNE